MRTMPAGEFKAKCLALMDEVQDTGQTVIVTKRGKPVARLMGLEKPGSGGVNVDSIFNSLRGLVTATSDLDSLVDPIIPLEDWDHLKDDWSLFPPE